MGILETAWKLTQHGISVVPVLTNGSKAAAVPWKKYQEEIADPQTLQRWFGAGTTHGLAIICGKVSGFGASSGNCC